MEELISENKRLKEENEEIREASLRNAVKFGMVARKNREYIHRIEQLEKQLHDLRHVESDEDENESPFRGKRKRPVFLDSSDEETCQTKKIKQEVIDSVGPEKETSATLPVIADWLQKRDGPKGSIRILHESECWIVCCVGDSDGYVLRQPKERHDEHCTVIVTDEKCRVTSCGLKQYISRTNKKYEVFRGWQHGSGWCKWVVRKLSVVESEARRKRWSQQDFDDTMARSPWEMLRLLHGHILRPCQNEETPMSTISMLTTKLFGEAFCAEPTEIDFSVDLSGQEISVVILHRCKCWLVFGVLTPPSTVKIYALRYSECQGEPMCDIKTVGNYSHTVTNCNGAQANFVCKYNFNKSRNRNDELSISHKRFLLEEILRDRDMFKIPQNDLARSPWEERRLLHGHILRPCQNEEAPMSNLSTLATKLFGKNLIAEPAELDFTADLTAQQVSVVIFHRCECWLVLGVLTPQYPVKICVLQYSECRGAPMCDIKTVEKFSYAVTNCNGTQAKFVGPYYVTVQRTPNGELIIQHKRFLLKNILRDRDMFKIPQLYGKFRAGKKNKTT